jgi:hypothetical protein
MSWVQLALVLAQLDAPTAAQRCAPTIPSDATVVAGRSAQRACHFTGASTRFPPRLIVR